MHFLPEQIISKENIHASNLNFIEGAVLLVDKPLGWTSFDVVNKVRYKLCHTLKVKKIKVGHAGTLDPMATGLLLLCTGKLTKKIDFLQAEDKVYSGTMSLGATTPTYDTESLPDAEYPVEHITHDMILNVQTALTGAQMQVPPVFSAIKIDGKSAYKLARRGTELVMQPRPVTIFDFKITNHDLKALQFLVTCSKGTYIRSLVHDFGQLLASGAYLTSLRREKIGEFSVNQAFTIESLCSFIDRIGEK
jgi:tRNA pseudouridine55 synthase